MGIAGLLLLVAAIEIMVAHQITLDPERDDDGRLTARGQWRQRQDLVVGVAFIVAGGALVAIGIGGLAGARPVAEVGDEGIVLRIAGPRRSVTLGWDDIAEVRSAREPGDGRGTRPLLLVRLRYPALWPVEYWGARRDGPWLVVDADTWTLPPEELVVHAMVALKSHRREPLVANEDDV